MKTTPALPAILQPAVDTARQSRLCITRSHACVLLNNRADEDEIRGAIDSETRAALIPAMEGAAAEQAPASLEALAMAIGKFVGLAGQNWTRDGREEFIGLAVGELCDLPGGMVLDALERARRRVTDGRYLISWVCDDVEPKAAKLKAECEQLARLAELSLIEG